MKRPAAFDALSIGNLARILGGISDEDLHRAVEYQQKHPRTKIGEVLVRLRIISAEKVDALLRAQQDMRDGKASPRDIERMVEFAVDSTERYGDQFVDAVAKVRDKLR